MVIKEKKRTQKMHAAPKLITVNGREKKILVFHILCFLMVLLCIFLGIMNRVLLFSAVCDLCVFVSLPASTESISYFPM